MHQSKILYEPLPVARVGLVERSKHVIFAHDYSCLARMLEEYISFGATKICLPQSSPELSSIEQMPPLLEKRIEVFDDTNEIEATRRLLHAIGREFDVSLSEDGYQLGLKRRTSPQIAQAIKHVYSLVRKLSIGFNHKILIDINPSVSIKHLRVLREVVEDVQSRLVLAQVEALLGLYEDVDFRAPMLPKETAPSEIISIYDRLVNDHCFLEYSEALFDVADPSRRQKAMRRIRDVEQHFKDSELLAVIWNYSVRILTVFNQMKLPEFREISAAISTLVNGRTLPALVNLELARGNAISAWKKTDLVEVPLNRSGLPHVDDGVIWMPPSISFEMYSADDKPVNFGSAERLLEKLREVLDKHD